MKYFMIIISTRTVFYRGKILEVQKTFKDKNLSLHKLLNFSKKYLQISDSRLNCKSLDYILKNCECYRGTFTDQR